MANLAPYAPAEFSAFCGSSPGLFFLQKETLPSVTSALKLSAEFFNIFRAKRISAKAERVPAMGAKLTKPSATNTGLSLLA